MTGYSVLQFTLGSTNAGGRFFGYSDTYRCDECDIAWMDLAFSFTRDYNLGVRSGHQFRGREPRKGRAMLPDLKVNLEIGLVALITRLS